MTRGCSVRAFGWEYFIPCSRQITYQNDTLLALLHIFPSGFLVAVWIVRQSKYRFQSVSRHLHHKIPPPSPPFSFPPANSLVKFHISSQLLSQTLAVKTGRGCASLFLRISRHFVGVFLIIVPFLATEMRSSM